MGHRWTLKFFVVGCLPFVASPPALAIPTISTKVVIFLLRYPQDLDLFFALRKIMPDSLNVIALISGGKDSFFSLLHCIQQGHRVVALANLYPASDDLSKVSEVQRIEPGDEQRIIRGDTRNTKPGDDEETDLNSFMYQTVGHQVIPLYAATTGLPLYRHPILGGASRHERDYDYNASSSEIGPEEVESMIPLLEAIKKDHPEANAVCAGAILSTYQRTRVESIALRLGLSPLAYLWKYPVLPSSLIEAQDDTQLLKDMMLAGLDARIIKVASAGLGADHLWKRVSSLEGANDIKRALRKFGTGGGAVLGEGGEFESLVVDGPGWLFKKRVVVTEDERRVIDEGAGTSWLSIQKAWVEEKPEVDESLLNVRVPGLHDPKFRGILLDLLAAEQTPPHEEQQESPKSSVLGPLELVPSREDEMLQWTIVASGGVSHTSIEDETKDLIDQLRGLLSSNGLEASQITNTVIVLRSMSDFPRLNAEYGKLFSKPNPPSRVTVSSGDLLPQGHNVILHVIIPKTDVERNGLHVQSRSYWAPANIGPYSQAIESNITLHGQPAGLKAVAIAGQIPLIPATMDLPMPSDVSLQQEIVLSLQHLWRIGAQMKLQQWTSAVAFFSRCSSPAEMTLRAQIASDCWKAAHKEIEEADEVEGGPDLWDMKYNPEYRTLVGGVADEKDIPLPDTAVFTLRQQNDSKSCVPPFFAVEVESLPRGSTVEWHAHLGLGKMEESSTELIFSKLGSFGSGWSAYHMAVRFEGGVFMHTVVAATENAVGKVESSNIGEKLDEIYIKVMKDVRGVEDHNLPSPYLTYFGKGCLESFLKASQMPPGCVPCHSILGGDGTRYGFIGVWRMVLSSS